MIQTTKIWVYYTKTGNVREIDDFKVIGNVAMKDYITSSGTLIPNSIKIINFALTKEDAILKCRNEIRKEISSKERKIIKLNEILKNLDKQ